MTKTPTTREKLLEQARLQFWARGYSNVPVRSIAGAAGVDVALISRHFGSKLGLFEASLHEAFDALELPDTTEGLIEYVVAIYCSEPREAAAPSLITLITSNAHDEDVGPLVREQFRDKVQDHLDRVIGDPGRAALLMAALIGFAVAEKGLRLPGIAPAGTPEFEVQLRQLIRCALGPDA
ncbi:MAG: TetR/AcrR family transcriptional regulator [Pseudooceanicola sp.]